MKFKPNGTWLLVQESELREFEASGEFVFGVVIGSNVNAYTYVEGTTVVYKKEDRTFLGLGFPNEFVVVKDENVVGTIEREENSDELTPNRKY